MLCPNCLKEALHIFDDSLSEEEEFSVECEECLWSDDIKFNSKIEAMDHLDNLDGLVI